MADRKRLCWNAHALGLLAYPMAHLAADDSYGVPPTAAGNHLRISFDPFRGMPAGGIHVFRRSYAKHLRGELRFDTTLAADRARLSAEVTMSPAPSWSTSGLVVPATVAAVFQIRTTVRNVALTLKVLRPGVEVFFRHRSRLVEHVTSRAEREFVAKCFDPCDAIEVRAVGAVITQASYLHVVGDLDGWEPLFRIPPIGEFPLTARAILRRIGKTGALEDVDVRDVVSFIRELRGLNESTAWPGAGGRLAKRTLSMQKLLSLFPRYAWGFGTYVVDEATPAEAVDYLAVACHGRWLGRIKTLLRDKFLGLDGRDTKKPVPPNSTTDRISLTTLIDRWTVDGAVYAAPAYRVERARGWTPAMPVDVHAEFDGSERPVRVLTENDEVRLDSHLSLDWRVSDPGRPRLLARQVSPLAIITTPDHTDVGAFEFNSDGRFTAAPTLSLPLPDATVDQNISVRSLDVFGHVSEPMGVTISLPQDLISLPPAPILVACVATKNAVGAKLSIAIHWGGRSRLLFPGCTGFRLEWLAEAELEDKRPLAPDAPWHDEALVAFEDSLDVMLADSEERENNRKSYAISGAGAGRVQIGCAIRQGVRSYRVIAVEDGRSIVDGHRQPREPAGPDAGWWFPTEGAARVEVVQKHEPIVELFPQPTRARPVVRGWVRVRTCDNFDRWGPPSLPREITYWSEFAPLADPAPIIIGRSPANAFQQCALRVRMEHTNQDLGYELYRADENRIRLALARWKARSNSDPTWTPSELFVPNGVLPQGVTVADITDPFATFAGLTDQLNLFLSRLECRADDRVVRVFDDVFEFRGRLVRGADATNLWANADRDHMELEDRVSGATTRYMYRVRAIDRALRRGPFSGTSEPATGLDLSPPARPDASMMITSDSIVVRWRPVADRRALQYRITRKHGNQVDVLIKNQAQLAAQLRITGEQVSSAEPIDAIYTLPGDVDRSSDFVTVAPKVRALWHAASVPPVLRVKGVRPLAELLSAEHRDGADGAHADITRLAFQRGVLNTNGLGLDAETGVDIIGPPLIDATPGLAFIADPFRIVDGLEEGVEVVLEWHGSAGAQPTIEGRSPADPAREPVVVENGCVIHGTRAGKRLAGIYRAAEVTTRTNGVPDPRRSGAKNLIAQARACDRGWVRIARDGVPLALKWEQLDSGAVRIQRTNAGGSRLRLVAGALRLPAWSSGLERLASVHFANHVTATDTLIGGAFDLAPGLSIDPVRGTITVNAPDGSPLQIRGSVGDEARVVNSRLTPLAWHQGTLKAPGLLGELGYELASIHASIGDGRDRSDQVRVTGTQIRVERRVRDGTALRVQTAFGDTAVDPAWLEYVLPIELGAVGTRVELQIEAITDVAGQSIASAATVMTCTYPSPEWSVPDFEVTRRASLIHVEFTPIANLTNTVELRLGQQVIASEQSFGVHDINPSALFEAVPDAEFFVRVVVGSDAVFKKSASRWKPVPPAEV